MPTSRSFRAHPSCWVTSVGAVALLAAGCSPLGEPESPLVQIDPDEVVELEPLGEDVDQAASYDPPPRAAGPREPTEEEVRSDASPDVKKEAREAYVLAKRKKNAGDIAGALALFVRADALYPGAAPKHEVAWCYDDLGQTADAIAAYQRFIDSQPSAKYADRITRARQRIKQLRAKRP